MNGHETHYADYDAPRLSRRLKGALCGAYITEREHSNEPTCRNCRQVLQERKDDESPALTGMRLA